MGKYKHGMRYTKEYRAWDHMKRRCCNVNDARYSNYGGRGITVCERWKNSFESFLEDMGECPPKYTLDRVDVNGNYEPGNCRWASIKEQQNNRTNNRLVTINGETKTLAQWVDEKNIKQATLSARLNKGWPDPFIPIVKARKYFKTTSIQNHNLN